MSRKRSSLIGLIVIMMASVVTGQVPLEIRAASAVETAGWRPMRTAGDRAPVWVAPTSQLTSADIARAEVRTLANGDPAVAVVFTDDGARKIAALSDAQISKPIAILLDGRLVWAPIVRSTISKEAVLSGGPGGLTPAEIQRLLASFKMR